ncbi:predicted protein [Streptomyces viridosporus ATCC 14672]|uniref:Predicted protein n=1 Tax=Streptomyces viridosporus (strain ATCC 14672 / DSM 40746 / JCM 4963 / KCTC 9882 / NRRL B-12104 / FH 1290) TaxID=566461 RepID=D6A245_STRV1|nr:predicted protein [Streptomyces viridosporus ATCC 14672]
MCAAYDSQNALMRRSFVKMQVTVSLGMCRMAEHEGAVRQASGGGATPA